MPALRFQTCRLLSGNVWNRELTIIQRRILRKLRNKKRSIKRKIYSRENLNSYIQSQTTRKLPLFHGDLPITEMHRGRERTSYIPFLLNPETRSGVILVRLRFRETIPQARQPISHRKVCVNNGMVSITHFKVSRGDIISFQENDARARGEEIRRSFYIEISVEKIIGKFRFYYIIYKAGFLLQRWFFRLLLAYFLLSFLGVALINLGGFFPPLVPQFASLFSPLYVLPGTPEVDCTLCLGQPEVDCTLRLGQPEVDCTLRLGQPEPAKNELGGDAAPSSSEGSAVHGGMVRPLYLKLAPLIEDKLKTYCSRKETVDLFRGTDLSTLDYKELSLAFVERYKGKMLSENQLNERRTFYNRLNSCDSTLFTFLKEKF